MTKKEMAFVKSEQSKGLTLEKIIFLLIPRTNKFVTT